MTSLLLFTLAARLAAGDTTPPGTLAGTVRDTISGQPVGLAVIRVASGGRGRSVMTDDEGHFQIPADPGPVRLELRRIGYRPRALVVTAPDTALVLYIAPVPVGIAGIT
ncbi:MAG TPA: carboxypeptidase regulatory-like domain-containing protein, partial [Gemmatimonadales bacterium]|nr:carboxypeptidase regulatory-like domain-containing protein [Gemmatimonadales bacterium]